MGLFWYHERQTGAASAPKAAEWMLHAPINRWRGADPHKIAADEYLRPGGMVMDSTRADEVHPSYPLIHKTAYSVR
jgi:hypothetical protein